MYPTMKKHLDDEHMRLYEWSGASSGMAISFPKKSKRDRVWHASYAVLGLLTSLLALSSCDRKGLTEQANEQVDQAIQDMKAEAASSPYGIAAKSESIKGARKKSGTEGP